VKQYIDLINHVLIHGEPRPDRTGTGVIGTFGYQARFNLKEGFPIVTTKKVPFRLIVEELLWFLRGSTNVRDLLDVNVKIWNADAYRWFKKNNPDATHNMEEFLFCLEEGTLRYEAGELGPIYGKQWRSWETEKENDFGLYKETIDQISNVIESIKNDPYGRRHIVSAWNVGDIDKMALPPCHVLFQFYVNTKGELSCQLYQRSADLFLGVPFNIASYALLTHIIAKECGLEVGEFIHTFGDVHIYQNHTSQMLTQIKREPRHLPKLVIRENPEIKSIFDYVAEDFSLEGYYPDSAIKGDVSVGN
jgi:thymidylate synthase